jgi:hypothetical protein
MDKMREIYYFFWKKQRVDGSIVTLSISLPLPLQGSGWLSLNRSESDEVPLTNETSLLVTQGTWG